jgi:tetratricopeptide (TPR) repeat protein
MGKGFGKPTAVPTRDATRFMVAFGKCYSEAKGDKEKIHQFLKANLNKLDETLLEALPLIFNKLIAEGKFGDRENVAALFCNFGNRIWEFPLGNRALNLELSITASQAALKIFTRDNFPEYWANTQNNLGIAYSDRIRGNRAESLEKAITAYQLALQVVTRQDFPEYWADIQNNLGGTYSDRIQGDRAENLEQAIAAFQLALQVRTRQDCPEHWADTQNNLGNAYSNRIRGDRAENLEQAIATYQLALQVRTQEDFPEEWAETQSNLGVAYSSHIRGDRAENLEQAITAFQLTLQVKTQKDFPEDWAGGQYNLANAYRDRLKGNLQKNLENAIHHYESASQILTRDDLPLKWVENQSDLAEALLKQAELTENPQDLDKAITLLQEVLEVAVPGSPVFIDSQYRLGNALSRRFKHNKDPEDLRQALQAYKTALDAISPEHYDREKIWQALPTTQTVLGSRLVREGQWQEGLQLLLNSVRLLRDSDDPLAHANALYETGRAYEVLADWSNARLYYRDALRLFEHLNDLSGIAKSRHGLGSVLASQGYFQKGMAELAKARELYQKLDRPDRVAEVDALYETTQRAEQNLIEVAV